MKRIILFGLVLFASACQKEPQCLECVKGSERIEICDGEHTREAYLYTSQGYDCRTY